MSNDPYQEAMQRLEDDLVQAKAENKELRKFRDSIVGDYINDGRVVYMRDSEVSDEQEEED